jgi:hypothetical protein
MFGVEPSIQSCPQEVRSHVLDDDPGILVAVGDGASHVVIAGGGGPGLGQLVLRDLTAGLRAYGSVVRTGCFDGLRHRRHGGRDSGIGTLAAGEDDRDRQEKTVFHGSLIGCESGA